MTSHRPWLLPAVVLGLAIVAISGNAIVLLDRPCEACRQQLITYSIGLTITLAAFLAALAAAAPIMLRRFLMFAGLVFAVNLYLGLAGRPWSEVGCETAGSVGAADCDSGQVIFAWNLVCSIGLVGLAMWAAFRSPPGGTDPTRRPLQ